LTQPTATRLACKSTSQCGTNRVSRFTSPQSPPSQPCRSPCTTSGVPKSIFPKLCSECVGTYRTQTASCCQLTSLTATSRALALSNLTPSETSSSPAPSNLLRQCAFDPDLDAPSHRCTRNFSSSIDEIFFAVTQFFYPQFFLIRFLFTSMDKDGGMLPPSYSPTILLCHFLCQNLYHCWGRGALYCVEEHKGMM
jgi:hypothetical protein